MSANFSLLYGAAGAVNYEQEYVQSVQDTCSTPDGQGLFSLDSSSLLASRATIIVALHLDGRARFNFAGGVHAVGIGTGAVQIKGAVVDALYRGHGLFKRLAALARLLAGAVETTAVVRVYPDGRVNLASAMSLSAVGIDRIEGLGRGVYKGDRFDRHLHATLEPDGRTFRYLRLAGAPSLEQARRIAVGEGNV
jgi:hypothetical protein